MLYSHIPQTQYYLIPAQNSINRNSPHPAFHSPKIDPISLRKEISKKLDLLYEECINKSNKILKENEELIQDYLSRKSSLTSQSNKENKHSNRQIMREIKTKNEENKPIELNNNRKILEETKNTTNSENEPQKKKKSLQIAEILVDSQCPNKISEDMNTLQTEPNILEENRFKVSPEQIFYSNNASDNRIIQEPTKDDFIRNNENVNVNETSTKFEEPKVQTIEIKPKNIELRLQLDELFEKCTRKTRECLETNQLKSELHTVFPLIQTKFFEDGSFYRGILQNGMRHGQGVLYNPLGKEIYNGEWENDAFSGKGIFNFKNSARHNESDWISYEGIFKNGKFEGLGKLINKAGEINMKFFKDGEIYEDDAKKDRLNTSLNKINEEEEKSGEEHIEKYFQEEFEQRERESFSQDILEEDPNNKHSPEKLNNLVGDFKKKKSNEKIESSNEIKEVETHNKFDEYENDFDDYDEKEEIINNDAENEKIDENNNANENNLDNNFEDNNNDHIQETVENFNRITYDSNDNLKELAEKLEGNDNLKDSGEDFKKMTNDSNENLKKLAEDLEGDFDDYELDFIP